jgi:hypothetical protein
MAQSGFLSLEATNPLWSGPLVDLGSFKDAIFRHETTRAMEIAVRIDEVPLWPSRGRPHPVLDVEIAAEVKTAAGAPEGRLKKLRVKDVVAGEEAALVRTAGRHESFRLDVAGKSKAYGGQPWNGPGAQLGMMLKGARRTSIPALANMLMSGALGEMAATVQRVSSGREPPRRTYERGGGVTSEQQRRLFERIDAVALEKGRQSDRKRLRKVLADGLLALGIANDLEVARLSDYHTAVQLTDNRTGVTSNLADFGYGASQVIPVLEACSTRGPGPLFVEQPEIHLHPRAQGELAELLCNASRRRQMIIETHSEHMINRARRLVAEGKMQARDIVVQYVDRDQDGSRAQAIDLDEAGDFVQDWPEGFFDERFKETMKIAEAQAKRSAQ